VCVVVVLVMLVFTGHADFVTNLNSFLAQNFGVKNAYQATIKAGGTADLSFSLWQTILAAVYASLILAFPHWGVQQAGEIKRANSLRGNIFSVAGAEVFSFVIIAIFAALVVTKVGHEFLYASGSLYFSGSPKNPLPVPPFFGFFVSLASGSAIFIWIAFVMFFSWFIMLAPNAPLGATRVMLAMSFDRVLPDCSVASIPAPIRRSSAPRSTDGARRTSTSATSTGSCPSSEGRATPRAQADSLTRSSTSSTSSRRLGCSPSRRWSSVSAAAWPIS
jgi:hypothetical protein